MRIETILNAMEKAKHDNQWRHTFQLVHRRLRQYHVFRTRIIRMDEEKNDSIKFQEKEIDSLEIRLSNAIFELNAKNK